MEPSSILLKNTRLAVEISRPGSLYAGSRFDWTGFITQVTLDGQHTFCVPEDYDPEQGSHGVGLCNEFGIDAPIGYEDCPVGGTFPKLGIGLLLRPDGEPYNFFRPYTVVQAFPLEITQDETSVTFTLQPLETRGYAARLVKRLSLAENRLEIAYTLTNTGAQPLHTNEYVHNFIGIDQQPLGPDYCLTLSAPVEPEPMPWQAPGNHLLRISGREIRLSATPQGAFYLRMPGPAATTGAQWQLQHLPSGVSMGEFDDFAPMRAAVWGQAHVISAEMFMPLALAPGAAQSWTRRFLFS